MSFHKKALIGFLIFHLVVTGGILIAGFAQDVPTPTNDRDMVAQGVWPYVTALFLLVLSLVGLVIAYLLRGVLQLVKRLRKTASA
jgi:lysylphosphatidylglycerol synthetase-like protein (DUF2156 family)